MAGKALAPAGMPLATSRLLLRGDASAWLLHGRFGNSGNYARRGCFACPVAALAFRVRLVARDRLYRLGMAVCKHWRV